MSSRSASAARITMRKCLPSVGPEPGEISGFPGDLPTILLSPDSRDDAWCQCRRLKDTQSLDLRSEKPRHNKTGTRGSGGELTCRDMYHHQVKKPAASYAALQRLNVCSLSSVATGKCLIKWKLKIHA